MWNDPEYLRSLVQYAHRVTVNEAEDHTVALKVATIALP